MVEAKNMVHIKTLKMINLIHIKIAKSVNTLSKIAHWMVRIINISSKLVLKRIKIVNKKFRVEKKEQEHYNRSALITRHYSSLTT